MLKNVPKAFVGQTDGQSLVVTKDAPTNANRICQLHSRPNPVPTPIDTMTANPHHGRGALAVAP